MKRFIAILTLALTAALSADKASAQDFFGIPMVNTAESGLDDISGSILRFAATEVGIMDLIDLSWFGEQHKIYDYSQCIWNDITFNEHATSDLEGLIAIIALAATETGIIDPDDCPTVGKFDSSSTSTQMMPDDDMGHNLYFDPHWLLQKRNPNDCPDLVDLWFELVDAGYTEDEAFDLIEMAMDEDGWLVGGGYKLWTDTGATGY
jgi:hypothetical protein